MLAGRWTITSAMGAPRQHDSASPGGWYWQGRSGNPMVRGPEMSGHRHRLSGNLRQALWSYWKWHALQGPQPGRVSGRRGGIGGAGGAEGPVGTRARTENESAGPGLPANYTRPDEQPAEACPAVQRGFLFCRIGAIREYRRPF